MKTVGGEDDDEEEEEEEGLDEQVKCRALHAGR